MLRRALSVGHCFLLARDNNRWPLSLFLLVFMAGCSTALSPYAQVEDDPNESADAALDAGAPPRDAATGHDAGSLTPRDAGTSASRDAGGSASSQDCTRVPSNGVTSLLSDDCATRTARSCVASGQTPQQVVNQRLADIAKKCGSPSTATLGVVFGSTGCPTELRYDARIRDTISICMQTLLESDRVACSLRCALIGPGATLDLN